MPVRRTTIVLPAPLKRSVSELARRRGISMGALVRRAVEKEIASDGAGPDSLLDDTTVFRGRASRNTARDHDLYLYDK